MNRPAAFTPLEQIFRAGLAAVDPARLLARALERRGSRLTLAAGGTSLRLDLDDFSRVLVLGAGKASAAMAQAVETVLGERLEGGVIAVKYGHTAPLAKIETIEAGHPVPDGQSLVAARRIAAAARQADERTLVLNLVSGGGSALLAAPLEGEDGEGGPTLADLQKTTGLLLACGASIDEINAVRKHLSALAGGRLARLLSPARVVSLILSDVVGDRLDVIASGPTVGDPTTFADALAILARHEIRDRVPAAVRRLLEQGARGGIEESPKPGDAVFRRVDNLVVGSNLLALQAAADQARRLGYHTVALTAQATGEARQLARFLLAAALDVRRCGLLAPRPACLLAGGETTVTIQGEGKGGRNQELALAFLELLGKEPEQGRGIYLLSGATDGSDGPTDAAGAFAGAELLAAARRAGLDPADSLARNDSYHFFEPIGGLLKTGPTLTNVCDLQMVLVV